MTIENLIVIKGGAYNDIKKALRQWIDLYSKDLEDGLTFQLYKNGSGNHIIQADERLDNERFYYLVNYLNYSEGIENKIYIEGFATGKDKNKLRNKELLVYISPTDKEYDNVFVTTSESEHFKIDFGGRIKETSENKIYRLPNDLTFDAPETFAIKKIKNIEKVTEENTKTLTSRFKIIIAIVISAYFLTFLILNPGDYFMKANCIISFAVWGWFLFDYQILQLARLYFGSLALGLTIVLYGYFLDREFLQQDKSVLAGTTIPIFILILQRPLRFAFKAIIKREPIVDKPAPSFADFVYAFILSIASLVIPAFFYTK